MKIHLINYFLGFFLDNLETVNYDDTFFDKKSPLKFGRINAEMPTWNLQQLLNVLNAQK